MCMCIQALLYQKQRRKVWLDKSDEAFCTKSATKSTTEAVSRSVPTAFRLPHLHMKWSSILSLCKCCICCTDNLIYIAHILNYYLLMMVYVASKCFYFSPPVFSYFSLLNTLNANFSSEDKKNYSTCTTGFNPTLKYIYSLNAAHFKVAADV